MLRESSYGNIKLRNKNEIFITTTGKTSREFYELRQNNSKVNTFNYWIHGPILK